jgi:hypothetical protein
MQDRDRPAAVSRSMLPVLPPELAIDPLLAALLHLAAFLDLSDDASVDPDAAGEALEHVGLYVQRLDEATLDRLESELRRLAEHAQVAGWSEEQREFVEDFLYSCGIGQDEDEGEEETEGD